MWVSLCERTPGSLLSKRERNFEHKSKREHRLADASPTPEVLDPASPWRPCSSVHVTEIVGSFAAAGKAHLDTQRKKRVRPSWRACPRAESLLNRPHGGGGLPEKKRGVPGSLGVAAARRYSSSLSDTSASAFRRMPTGTKYSDLPSWKANTTPPLRR